MLVQGHTGPATKGQDGTLQCTGFSGVPKGWQEVSHSSFCPSPEEWCLKMGHAGGCFEKRLGYGTLSLGAGRERPVKGA